MSYGKSDTEAQIWWALFWTSIRVTGCGETRASVLASILTMSTAWRLISCLVTSVTLVASIRCVHHVQCHMWPLPSVHYSHAKIHVCVCVCVCFAAGPTLLLFCNTDCHMPCKTEKIRSLFLGHNVSALSWSAIWWNFDTGVLISP